MGSMIDIPEGWFWMGSDSRYPSEAPRHRVFTAAFRICSTTVTRREYACFLLDVRQRATPRGWEDPAFDDPDKPVVGVSWFDAVAYCDWLSQRTGRSYRLPWEAEWEKACKGGDDLPYAWGHEPPESLEYFQGEWSGPRPVAQATPNGYGLFNMGDNVHEWCADWYSPDYYAISPGTNPTGPAAGRRRASRGGSWRHAVKASRSSQRSSLPPGYCYTDYGFRLAESVDSDEMLAEWRRTRSGIATTSRIAAASSPAEGSKNDRT